MPNIEWSLYLIGRGKFMLQNLGENLTVGSFELGDQYIHITDIRRSIYFYIIDSSLSRKIRNYPGE